SGELHSLNLPLVGRHNALNACAVVALSVHLGLGVDAIRPGVESFQGTRRRFERVGEIAGVTVCDDYAHHPTAIRVTLEAARAHYRSPIWAIFQPHTVHRTLSLWSDFLQCFSRADHVILVPTYRPAGRETDEADPTITALAAEMDHPDARAMPA